MEITKNQTENALTIAPSGRLDTTTAPQFDEFIKANLGENKALVLDFKALEYISSAGLRVLLSCQKTMNAKNGTLVIKGANDSIKEVFDITGFSDLLTIE